MSAIQRLIEEEDEEDLQEFANLAFELLGEIRGQEKDIKELLDNNQSDQAFRELDSDTGDTKEKLVRMHELSVTLHEKYPQVVEELEEQMMGELEEEIDIEPPENDEGN